MPQKIEGYVIEDKTGAFLDGGYRYREISESDACVHALAEIEEIREAFHRHHNKPVRMRYAVRIGERTIVTGPFLSFYAASGSNQPYVGDCAKLPA